MNRVDIDERPEEANNRERIGDWEMDTIIGKNHKGAIVTMDDRLSKLRLAAPLDGKKSKGVTAAIIKLLEPIKDFVHTLTFDNGKEFSAHETIAKALDCNAYFAKPYHSWERGQNENANGLLRQYFPKAMELIDVTTKEVVEAVHRRKGPHQGGASTSTGCALWMMSLPYISSGLLPVFPDECLRPDLRAASNLQGATLSGHQGLAPGGA